MHSEKGKILKYKNFESEEITSSNIFPNNESNLKEYELPLRTATLQHYEIHHFSIVY